jgi:hypothetical protein
MRRGYLLGIAVAIIAVFFFAPVLREEWGNFGGGPDTVGWVSPSFALFQCGAYMGGVGIQVPNGAAVNVPGVPFWESSSNWNCAFPHWMS